MCEFSTLDSVINRRCTSRVSQRGRLRVKEERGLREKRQTLCRATLFFFFCAARLDLLPRLPKSDSPGLLPAIDVNGPPKGGWVRDRRKKGITCQRPSGRHGSSDSSVPFVCLRLALREWKRREKGKKGGTGCSSATEPSRDRSRYGEHCGTAARERSYHVSVLHGTPLG